MKIEEEGHVYELNYIDASPDEVVPNAENILVFVNREEDPHPGTQTQEVLRALIDRTMHCDNCLRWEGNDLIIYHLRMALVLHEARALIRKVQKGLLFPEGVGTNIDGHFELSSDLTTKMSSDWVRYYRKPKPDTPLQPDMGRR